MATWPTSVATDAILYVAVNNLQTALSGSIDNVVTTITLASTTGFQVAGGVTIDTEVIFYTGISGAQLTGCTRGADGTTAASHSSGVPVGATVIAAHHNLLKNEIIAIESSLNLTASQAVVTSASGRVTTVAVTPTEVGYLAGVTSAIQTQINGKVSSASPTFTGVVTIADGSAAAPSLTFSDSDTGFYHETANTLAATVGGNRIMDWSPNAGYLRGTGTAVLELGAIHPDTVTSTAHARMFTEVGGASSGDPYFLCTIDGASHDWSFGTDNSDSDKFKVSQNTTLGTNDYLTIDITGNVTLNGTLALGTHKITGVSDGAASGEVATFGQLKIIQTVSFTTTSSTSTTSSTFTSTALTASITPTSSSNKILVWISGEIRVDTTATACVVTIDRSSTNIGDATNGFVTALTPTSAAARFPCSIVYLDSPATTSSRTYTVQIKSTDNASTVRWNQAAGKTSMVLMEVV